MSEVRFSERFSTAVERTFEFLAESDPGRAAAHVEVIVEGVQLLAGHPLIGRRFDPELRELVVGKGTRCHVVLYEYDAAADRVTILTVRHASHAGYRG